MKNQSTTQSNSLSTNRLSFNSQNQQLCVPASNFSKIQPLRPSKKSNFLQFRNKFVMIVNSTVK